MKYWDCIRVPAKTNEEGAQTSAPSPVDEAEIIPETAVEVVEEPSSRPSPFEYTNAVIGGNYADLCNQVLGRIPSQSVEDVVEDVEEEEPEEVEDEVKEDIESEPEEYKPLVSVDEVDESKFLNDGEVEFTEVEFNDETDNPIEETTFEQAMEENKLPEVKVIDKDALLGSILDNAAPEVETVEDTKLPEPEVVKVSTSNPENTKHRPYQLEEWQVQHIMDAIDKYSKEYFPNLPPNKNIVKDFLYNIPKETFTNHQKATDKHGYHPIFDPIFWMVPAFSLLTEFHRDPAYAMGEFLHRVCVIIDNDDSLQNEINARSDTYMELINADDEELEEDEELENEESEETTE